MAKHGAHVIQALATVVQHGMFNGSAHHTRCVFGPQRKGFAIEVILKGVHLLLDNIGHLAQTADKQGCRLNNRGSDIAIGIARHQRADLAFQPFPARRIRREYVVHALDGGQFLSLDGGQFVSFCGS